MCMKDMYKVTLLAFILALCVYSPVIAEEKAKDKINEPGQEYRALQISPIFSQLVLLSLPKGFKVVFENMGQDGKTYIREAVLEGETVDQWSQMITVTGVKGEVAVPNVAPKVFAERFATRFKGACPDTFFAKALAATKISEQDAFIILIGCGSVQRNGGAKQSETALVIVIKGSADYYTIQWAERGDASSQPIAPNEAEWIERFKKLNPIKICPRTPGEAAPYPSCINQK